MNRYILSAIMMVLLTNGASADEQSNQSKLITTYDPGEATLQGPIFPDRSNLQSKISFEGQTSERPLKFNDEPKEQEYVDIDKVDPSLLLADISFDDELSNNNERIFNRKSFDGETENDNQRNKIKFEGNDEEENSEDQESEEGDDHQNDGSQVVFEDDGNSDDDDSDYQEDSETESDSETADKPIKFKNQDDDASDTRDSERNPVTERVLFIDDSKYNQEPPRKKKRKPKTNQRFQDKQSNPAPTAPSSPYPGLGYPGYPGVGYPGPGYPGPGDPNTGYPGYPTPNFPAPGYPYPNYASSYPSVPYPTPNYPGYAPYSTMYPPMGPGYGAYPTPGYQVPGDQRPPTNPIAYPNPSDQNGHSDTRYPSQDYAASPSSGPAQNGLPAPYPGAEYPYYQGYPVPGYPPAYPVNPNSQYPGQMPYRPLGYPGIQQQGYQRPSRRPKSLTQRAVSAVAEALTSIAMYDDYQCVPRILCEVAGGSTASSSALLKASSSLQPLLTLLQAYNGVSSSPLFIFGRAAVTGVTAKGNPSACYRAYPQCPTDPEKLINYLNNHNGGFFRFFGQPGGVQQPQNLEQFYNYLSGQDGQPPQQQQQNYGYPRPYGYGFQGQNPYGHPQNYGRNFYHEQIGYRNAKDIKSEIEERIQNKPGVNALDDEKNSSSNDNKDKGSKWAFPEEASNKKGNEREKNKTPKQPERLAKPERQQPVDRPNRASKTLKFPDDRSDDRREIFRPIDYPRKQKNILFPGEYHSYYRIEYQPQSVTTNYYPTTTVNPEEYIFDHKHKFYVQKPKVMKYENVVYVVRGNGDPNHPEIVRVKPGQNI